METTNLVPNISTFADLCDRLAVTVHKLGFFENKKREEQLKDEPDRYLIAHWDHLSRTQCEHRNKIKEQINKLLTAIVKNRDYSVLPDPRTFEQPKETIADILADHYSSVNLDEFKKKFGKELERKFGKGF